MNPQSSLNDNVPVCKFPFEVLKYIFEETMELKRKRFKQSIIISHVCKKWRDVALDAPKLWSFVHVSCAQRRTRNLPFVNWMRERANNAPVDISVIDLYAEYDCNPAESCFPPAELFGFPAINCLSVEMRDAETITQLIPILGACSAKEVILFFNSDADRSDSWDCHSLLQHLPNIHTLCISDSSSAQFDRSQQSTSIRRLILSAMRVELSDVFAFFPQLEQLECDHLQPEEYDIPEGGQPINLSHLNRLKIMEDALDQEHVLMGWLPYMACPTLTEMITDQRAEDMIDFLSSHPSLVSYHALDLQDLPTFATAAPNLRCLTININRLPTRCMEHLDYLMGELLRLESLKLDYSSHLPVERFDAVVCSRCLPDKHSQNTRSRFITAIMTLIMGLPFGIVPEKTAWAGSSLYAEATKAILPCEDRPRLDEVHLSWN